MPALASSSGNLMANPEMSRMATGLPFRKMHGLGNDFVIIDARKTSHILSNTAIARIADRRLGVGCDQLIVLEASAHADARMRIFNPDGGEVGACGNATRCIGQLLMQENGKTNAAIETQAGLLLARQDDARIAVDMGLPQLDWQAIPLSEAVETDRVALDTSALNANLPSWFSAVNIGNPHGIFFVDDVEAHDLARIGPVLETHPIFPEKANISLASIRSRSRIHLKVWERAAGLTLACGTAACATAVAAQRLGFVDDEVEIRLPGGSITIRRSPEGRVIMIGAVATAFSGTLDPDLITSSDPAA